MGNTGLVEEDVRRLQVAVHESHLVGVLKGLGHAEANRRAPAGHALHLEVRAERLALDVFACDVGRAGHLAGVVHLDDAGVLQARRAAGLGHQSGILRGDNPIGSGDFQSHEPLEDRVAGLPDGAKTARTQFLQELESPEARVRFLRFVRGTLNLHLAVRAGLS